MGWADSKIVYLSGPMTGLPGHNYEAFNREARRLRSAGYLVINPAENFGGELPSKSRPREAYMRVDIASVLKANIVAVLPGWPKSPGALTELAVAFQIGTPVVDVKTMKPLPKWMKVRARYEDIGEFIPGERPQTKWTDSQEDGPRDSEGV